MTNKEFLLCFDEQGNILPPQERTLVHAEPVKIWHGVTNIWVFNKKGEILCTRRSLSVSGNPGKWQTYVGGHVQADSTFKETSIKEVGEELGLHPRSAELMLVEKGARDEAKHFFESYVMLLEQDLSNLHFSDGEISEARWVDFKEYQKSKEESPEQWCNSMKPEQYEKALELLNIEY